MRVFGVPAVPDLAGAEGLQEGLNLGAWFQKGWTFASGLGDKSADSVSAIFDRFREAESLGFDNEEDQTEN